KRLAHIDVLGILSVEDVLCYCSFLERHISCTLPISSLICVKSSKPNNLCFSQPSSSVLLMFDTLMIHPSRHASLTYLPSCGYGSDLMNLTSF
ncbi:hypothetical protein Y032_0270g837, partial [Ancylostoma ceylanicum]